MPKKEKAWEVEPRTLLDIVAHNEHKLLGASLEDNKEEVLSFRDKYGVSALHAAALYNHLVLATTLIDAGCNLDAQSDVGTTPLHLASDLGHYEMVALLIDSGANPAPLNDQFEMPLQLARKNKHSRIVVLLEPLVAPLTSKHLTALEAASAGDVLYLVNLVDGSNVAYGEVFVRPVELDDVTEQGKETLLTTILKQEAVQATPVRTGSSGSEEAAAGAEVTVPAGFTEKHFLTLEFILVKKLLSVDQLNRPNAARLTPLMMAVKGGHFSAAMMLLKHGANPTLRYDEEEATSKASSLTQDAEMILVLLAEEKKYIFDTQLELRNSIAYEGRAEYIKQMKQARKEMRMTARDLDVFRRRKQDEADLAEQTARGNGVEGGTVTAAGASGDGRPTSGSARPSTRPPSGGTQ